MSDDLATTASSAVRSPNPVVRRWGWTTLILLGFCLWACAGPFGPKGQTPSSGVAAGATQTIGRNMTLVTVAGIALTLAGIACFVLKAYLPVLPTTAGSVAVVAGVGLIVLAVFLPQIVFPWWVWLLLIVSGAAVVGLSWWATRRDKLAVAAAQKEQQKWKSLSQPSPTS